MKIITATATGNLGVPIETALPLAPKDDRQQVKKQMTLALQRCDPSITPDKIKWAETPSEITTGPDQ